MPRSENRPNWLFPLGMGLLSAVFYHLSLLGLLFLVPLQMVVLRRGWIWMLISCGVSIAIIVGVTSLWAVSEGRSWTLLDFLALSLALSMMAGWILIVVLERTGWRFLVRLSLTLLVAGAVLFPIAYGLLNDSAFQQELKLGFNAVWKSLLAGSETNPSVLNGVLPADLLKDPSALLNLMEEAVLSTFLLCYFVVWLVTWRLVRIWTIPKTAGAFSLKAFRLPPAASWILLGAWALFLGGALISQKGKDYLGFWAFVLSNVAWISLVVHALAGLGIVQSLLERWRWPAFSRTLVLSLLAVFCCWFGSPLEVVTLVGLTGLSVLELWVNFRNYQSSSEESS